MHHQGTPNITAALLFLSLMFAAFHDESLLLTTTKQTKEHKVIYNHQFNDTFACLCVVMLWPL